MVVLPLPPLMQRLEQVRYYCFLELRPMFFPSLLPRLPPGLNASFLLLLLGLLLLLQLLLLPLLLRLSIPVSPFSLFAAPGAAP